MLRFEVFYYNVLTDGVTLLWYGLHPNMCVSARIRQRFTLKTVMVGRLASILFLALRLRIHNGKKK